MAGEGFHIRQPHFDCASFLKTLDFGQQRPFLTKTYNKVNFYSEHLNAAKQGSWQAWYGGSVHMHLTYSVVLPEITGREIIIIMSILIGREKST